MLQSQITIARLVPPRRRLWILGLRHDESMPCRPIDANAVAVMSSALRDAVNFAISLPPDTAPLTVAADAWGELSVEWWKGDDVLEVTFDGDGEYRYARRKKSGRYKDDFFVAKVGELPDDLKQYLDDMRTT